MTESISVRVWLVGSSYEGSTLVTGAASFSVDHDGNLIVWSYEASALAIFRDQNWAYAEVENETDKT